MGRGGRFLVTIKTRCVPKSKRKNSLNMGQFGAILGDCSDCGDTFCQASDKLCDYKKRGWSRNSILSREGAAHIN